MKKLFYPIVALLLFSFAADDLKLTDAEREKAVEHLTKSRDHMMEVLDGLSEDQLNFKSSEASWSIAECVEHLAISENAFGGLIQMTVQEGNNPAMKDSVAMKDDELYAIITNRSQKVKTSEQFEPSGKFGSHEETVEAFNKKREEHIAYVKSTQDDLRNRFNSNLPFGTVDGYQLILFAAGHAERHVLQMEEIMAHEDFPEEDMDED